MNCSDLFERMIIFAKENKLKPNILYYFVIEEKAHIAFCLQDTEIVQEELDTFLSVKEAEIHVKNVLVQNGISCTCTQYTYRFDDTMKYVIPFSFRDKNDIEGTSTECYHAYVIDP